jgi:CO/xanthine dehydrogenase Mo-binding subunit
VGKRPHRLDAVDKVTGQLRYPSDRTVDGALWVVAVRSPHPHARVRSIVTTRAEAVDGVVRVLTAADVPGENGFGIAIQDQPVLCADRVRYQGDAIVLVGAETRQAALRGAAEVQVEFDVLEPVCDPEQAMLPAAPKLHPGGNILHEGHFAKGDIEEGFRRSAVIVERSYQLPMIEHAYLEPEAGLSYFDDQGRLTVESCGQYVYRDQTQIARALGLPLDQVRVVGSYVGGAFGGKDEITVQIHLALMSHHTRRPARMVASRPESLLFSTKRHAAKIHYKTGASKSGKLMAVQARFVSDTGAYASLGGPVLNLMIEHAAGPYLVPHTRIDAFAVYTNNGFAGAFRGFGCTQACVAIESQMDLMARALGRDPLAFRQANALHKGDRAALGYEMVTAVGAEATIKSARRGKLWRERKRIRKDRSAVAKTLAPYIRRGVGAASQMQGLGLGVGLPDYCEVELALTTDGRVTLYASTSEIGQGAYSAYAQMAAERLGVDFARVSVVGGDTGLTPDSGTTTASRTTYAVGNAILMAGDILEKELGRLAAQRLGFPAGPARLDGEGIVGTAGQAPLDRVLDPVGLKVRASYHLPVAEVELGDGLPHILYSYGTHVALVEVNTLTGQIAVRAVEAHLDGGQVISRSGFEGQSEGGVAQGIGYALSEEVRFARSDMLTRNFDTYLIPTSLDVPTDIRTQPVIVREPTGPFGAKGISETAMVGPCPAVLNALEDAIGVRFTRLPVRAEDVLAALEERKP